MKPASTIIGLGKYLPEQIVTNDEFVKLGLETSDSWIRERTGIISRRVSSPKEASSDLAFHASKQALKSAGLEADQIDLIIVATTSPDYLGFPSTACILQEKLGIKNCPAFDLVAACTGFSYGLTTASAYIRADAAKHILVVGTDTLTKLMNWKDRSTCILFGDGAGAAILSPCEAGYGIIASEIYASGADAASLMIKEGGTRSPLTPEGLANQTNTIVMEGKAVFKLAVQKMVPAIKKALKKVGLGLDDINYLVPHQANIRIIDFAREKLGLKKEQVLVNIDKYGNTSAASIPITLTEAMEANTFKTGEIVVCVGFGAGFTWGVNVIRWRNQT